MAQNRQNHYHTQLEQMWFNLRVGCLIVEALLNTLGEYAPYTAIQNAEYVQGGVERSRTRSDIKPQRGRHPVVKIF